MIYCTIALVMPCCSICKEIDLKMLANISDSWSLSENFLKLRYSLQFIYGYRDSLLFSGKIVLLHNTYYST